MGAMCGVQNLNSLLTTHTHYVQISNACWIISFWTMWTRNGKCIHILHAEKKEHHEFPINMIFMLFIIISLIYYFQFFIIITLRWAIIEIDNDVINFYFPSCAHFLWTHIKIYMRWKLLNNMWTVKLWSAKESNNPIFDMFTITNNDDQYTSIYKYTRPKHCCSINMYKSMSLLLMNIEDYIDIVSYSILSKILKYSSCKYCWR